MADWDGLENRSARKGTQGSNPCPSAPYQCDQGRRIAHDRGKKGLAPGPWKRPILEKSAGPGACPFFRAHCACEPSRDCIHATSQSPVHDFRFDPEATWILSTGRLSPLRMGERERLGLDSRPGPSVRTAITSGWRSVPPGSTGTRSAQRKAKIVRGAVRASIAKRMYRLTRPPCGCLFSEIADFQSESSSQLRNGMLLPFNTMSFFVIMLIENSCEPLFF